MTKLLSYSLKQQNSKNGEGDKVALEKKNFLNIEARNEEQQRICVCSLKIIARE